MCIGVVRAQVVHATPASVLLDLNGGEKIKSEAARIIPHRRRKMRKLRKLKKPKRPKTAYNFFQLDQKEYAQGCLVHNEEYARTIGQLWKHLTRERRAYYQMLSINDRRRYESENKEYLKALAGKMKKKKSKQSVKRESLPSMKSEPLSSEPPVYLTSSSEPSVSFSPFASEPPAKPSVKVNLPPFKESEPLSFVKSEQSYLTSDSEPSTPLLSTIKPSLLLKSALTPSDEGKTKIPNQVSTDTNSGTKRKKILDEPIAKRYKCVGLPDLVEDSFDTAPSHAPSVMPDEDVTTQSKVNEADADAFEFLDLDLGFDTHSPSIFNDQDHAFVDDALIGF